MSKYPIRDDTVRPFRIWHANAAPPQDLPHCNYLHKRSAVIGAWIRAKEMPIRTALEVYDTTTGQLIGQYVRRVDGVAIYKEKRYEK